MVQQGADIRDLEATLRRLDGSDFWSLLSVSAMDYKNRKSVLWWIYDITERKRNEQALREKSDFLRLNQVITRAANEATSVEAAMQIALDQVCAHTGWPVGHAYLFDEAAGDLAPSGIWHLDDAKAFETFRGVTETTRFATGVGLPGRVLASGEPAWVFDVTKDPNFPRAKLATEVGVRAGAAFPVLVGPKVAAVLEFFSAEAVEAYEPLMEVMSQIGMQLGRVVERTRAQSQLVAAKDEATQATQAKSQFLANMSHELRTPMNAIMGFTRLVMRRSKEDLQTKQYENLGKILISAEHLLALINNILDLSKIEAGQTEIHPADFSLEFLVDGCLHTLEPLVESNRERLVKEIEPDLPMLFTDEDKLKQILINLLSNAVKFTEEGTITLASRCHDGAIVITVRDSGIGIPEDALEEIFEEFQQVDSSSTRRHGGTGLGLAITRHLSELLGGHISVQSRVGVGSTFTVTVPRRYSAA